MAANGSLSPDPQQPTESSSTRPASRGARSGPAGRSIAGPWHRAGTSAIWSGVLVGLIGLTVWHALQSETLAEARAAYAGRPADSDLPSTTWWQRLWPEARTPAASRQRRSSANRPGQPDYVRALLRALDYLGNHPSDGETARLAGMCLSHMDYAAQAEPYYRIAQGKGQLGLDDLHVRALGLARGNLRDEAIAVYQEILERWPDDPLALQRLAAVFYSRAQYQESLKVASRLAQAADPKWAVAGYSLMGTVHHDQNHYELAVEANQKVLERDPELKLLTVPPELFWADFAEDLIQTSRAGDAREFLQRALRSSDNPALVNLLGAALYADGEEADAEQCWKHATAIDPKFDRPWLNLGKLAMRRGQLAEALSCFEAAHSIDSEAFESLYQLSLIYRRLGRTKDADQFGKRAAQAQRKKLKSSGSPRVGMGAMPDETP